MSRNARPIVVEADGNVSTLMERMSLGRDASYDEKWLQQLIYKHPDSLPFGEIEPGLGRFYSVCMELPTPNGYVDNLLVSAEGVLAVVETKLWRNPEARRKVIAQALDYASSIFAMDYEALEKAVAGAAATDGAKPGRILDSIPEEEALDEVEFIDAINANLRRGRMIVLVAGDGIRTELRSLASTLQSHAGVRFTFGLVEMAVFRLPDGRHVVHPTTLVKTEMIERGVVRIEEGRIVALPAAWDDGHQNRPTNNSSDSFFEAMAGLDKELPARLLSFLDKVREIGVEPEFKRSLILRYNSPDGGAYNLGTITRSGELWTDRIDDASRLSHDVARPYIESLSRLFDGRIDQRNQYWYVRVGNRVPKITAIVDKLPGWIHEIARLVRAIRADENEQGSGAGTYLLPLSG
jgi:hypothetical protein